MRCAQCQADAPDGSRFCPSCGRPLNAVTALLEADRTATSVIGLDEAITVAATAHLDADATRLADPATAVTAAGRESTDHDSLAPGMVIADRYRIERPLGKGGMGVVYLAYDERLKVPVALKCLPRSLARDPRRLEQFHNEVRLARLISHPNVCRVHDIGEIDGQLFLTVEYINGGGSLRAAKTMTVLEQRLFAATCLPRFAYAPVARAKSSFCGGGSGGGGASRGY